MNSVELRELKEQISCSFSRSDKVARVFMIIKKKKIIIEWTSRSEIGMDQNKWNLKLF